MVVTPANLNPAYSGNGLIYITGGGNGQSPPGADDEDVNMCVFFATATGTICSVLFQVRGCV